MNKFISHRLFLILFVLFSLENLWANNIELSSPDRNLKLVFNLSEKGEPQYQVFWKNQQIMSPSRLGVSFTRGGNLQEGLFLKKVEESETVDYTYPLVVGKTSSARDYYNQVSLSLQEKDYLKRELGIIFRVYNDGVAFRYLFPGASSQKPLSLASELSEFNFPSDYKCWAQHLPHFNSNFEAEFDEVTLCTIYGSAELKNPIMQYLYCFDFPADKYHYELVGLPLLVEIPGGPMLAVAEADLKNYPGMYLQKTIKDQPRLNSVLSPLRGGNGVVARFESPGESAWRVIMVGENSGSLIESNIILNLNRPLAIEDPSWIKPGKACWDFLAGRKVPKELGFEGGMNLGTLKYFIDFAAEFNLEYYLIDLGWCPGVTWERENPKVNQLATVDGINMEELAAYAGEKGVGLFLWARWDNIRDDMERVFSTFREWGIKGVKIDFMDSDDQYMVNWYETCISTAAKYNLLIDFHGAFKATGLTRTWPNYITQEGVKGLEWSNTDKNLNARHNVTLAYTRMLVGPMDYTPGGFNNILPKDYSYMDFKVITTRAQQLAMFVVYESPLMVLADSPQVYRGKPESEFLKVVPSSWDKTKFIEGKTAEYIIMARQHGKDWYLGGMTNDDEREVNMSLSFLEKGKRYKLTVYEDGSDANVNPTSVNIRELYVENEDMLKIKMAPRGGFAASLTEYN